MRSLPESNNERDVLTHGQRPDEYVILLDIRRYVRYFTRISLTIDPSNAVHLNPTQITPRQNVHQRTLASAGRAHDRRQLAAHCNATVRV